jgi:hypothetical protein
VRATFTPDKNHPIGVGSRDGSANLGAGWPMECPLSISALVAGCLTAAGADNEL